MPKIAHITCYAFGFLIPNIMSNFIKIQPHIEVKVPVYFEEEREVDVKINFRVSDDGFIYFGPMECYGSINKHKTMFELQKEFKENYEKQGYKFVEIKEVFIDKDFLIEYKADAKLASIDNKKLELAKAQLLNSFKDEKLAATKSLSEASLVAPYKLIGFAALSVESAITLFTLQ